MAATATLSIFVQAKDNMSKSFQQMGRSVTSFAKSGASALGGFLKAITSIRAFIAGTLLKKAFSTFWSFLDGPSGRQFETSWGKFRIAVDNIFVGIIDKFGPLLSRMLDELTGWVVASGPIIIGMVDALHGVIRSLVNVIAEMPDTIQRFGQSIGAVDVSHRARVNEMALRILEHEKGKSRYGLAPSDWTEELVQEATRRVNEADARAAQAKAASRNAGTPQGTAFDRWLAGPGPDVQSVRQHVGAGAGWGDFFRRYKYQFSGQHNAEGKLAGPGEQTNAYREADKAAQALVGTLESGLTNAIFAMSTGAMKASQSIKELGKAIFEDLLKQSIGTGVRMGLGALFGPMATAANGNVWNGRSTSYVPLHAYANGGPIYDSPHVAMIGEGRHKEAVVPLPDGKTIPVSLSGGGGGNTTNIFQISATDTQSFAEAMARAERKHGGVRKLAMNAAQTNRAFRGQFGIRR